ncbi:unnamed protein product, partial [Allacma fusca]|jgi:hypothetical protein
MKEN